MHKRNIYNSQNEVMKMKCQIIVSRICLLGCLNLALIYCTLNDFFLRRKLTSFERYG